MPVARIWCCPCGAENSLPALPCWKHRGCSARGDGHRADLGLLMAGSSGCCCLCCDHVKCCRQPFESLLLLSMPVWTSFRVQLCLQGVVFKQTEKKMLLNFLPAQATLPGRRERQQDLQASLLSPADTLSPWADHFIPEHHKFNILCSNPSCLG